MRRKAAKEQAKEQQGIKVEAGDPNEQPGWLRAGLIALVGLVLGLIWPRVAGIRVGPEVPGAKGEQEAAAETAPAAGESADPAPLPASSAAPAAAPEAPAVSNQQKVVVSTGRVDTCHKKGEKLEGEACGVLKSDRVIAQRLQELYGCPSALGLAGELEVGFDIDFEKSEVRVVPGKKGELPSSTVNGILGCIADYLRDVRPDAIPHTYPRYRVIYTLKFYPPGTQPSENGDVEEAAPDSDTARGLGTITWDTALVRSEPNTGDVVARLVRGTRVKLLGRRKDWYHVRIQEREGWVYRGALGL
jgi:hypothetical protein